MLLHIVQDTTTLSCTLLQETPSENATVPPPVSLLTYMIPPSLIVASGSVVTV